jgi:hypothetical protein
MVIGGEKMRVMDGYGRQRRWTAAMDVINDGVQL